MHRSYLLAALLAILSTAAWTSRTLEREPTDKSLFLAATFMRLGLSNQDSLASSRELLGHRDERYEEDYRGRRRRGRRRRDDEEDERERGRRGRRDRGPPRERPDRPDRQPGRRGRRGSSSFTHMRGVLRVVVRGNGESCFVRVKQRGMTLTEQFGDTTDTSAFINLFGHGVCEPGAKGIAIGFVRASVIAEAHSIGDTCETRVIAEVVTRTRDLDPDDGVDVIVGGAADGEALAVCDE